MSTIVRDFELALLVDRVVNRFAMEHDSPDALKEYLKEHPGADRKNHKVKKVPDAAKKNPFAAGAKKLERAMGKAPLESEKALKRLHRLKGRDHKGPTEGDKLRDQGREVHQTLVDQAEEVVKAIRGFMEGNDTEADSPQRMHAVEVAAKYMGDLERQIAESKKAGKGSFLSQIVEDGEKLHAGILNAASTMRLVVKGD